MKIIATIVGLAFLIIAGVLISIVQKGGALKPAGVIKPAEIGNDPSLIGKQIAVRLFPDFDEAKYVIWRIEDPAQAEIAYTALADLRVHKKPMLHDLRTESDVTCAENCWFIHNLGSELPESVTQQTKAAPTVEIYVQYFNRNEIVPEVCENEKILTVNCMKPIAVREVRRKLKMSAPHFFMQRYQKSQFYLFIEK